MPTFYLPTEPAVWIYATCREEAEACAEEMARQLRAFAAEKNLAVTIETCDEYRNHDFDHSDSVEADAILQLDYYYKTVPLWEIRDKAMEARQKIREREIEQARIRAENIRKAGLDQIAVLGSKSPPLEKKQTTKVAAGIRAPKKVAKPQAAKKTKKPKKQDEQPTSGGFLPVFNG